MNEQQRRFRDAYLINPNATQAAITAGYSEKTAYSQGQRLLKHVEVSEAIVNDRQERSEETKIDAAWVLTQAVEIVAAARHEDNHVAATGALKLVGQHVDVKALVERRETKVDATIADLTDEELTAKYAAMKKKQEEG